MKVFGITAIHQPGKSTERRAYYRVTAPTKGDAIMQGQKLLAGELGLNRSEEALVRIEFEPEG